MEVLQQILAMLASIAGVLGVVVGFLQYKISRQQPATTGAPAPGQYSWSAGPVAQAEAAAPTEPPAVVRVLAGWVVLDAVISVGLLFGLLTVIMANIYGFGFDVPELPTGIDVTGVVVLTALIGAAKLPAAIRRGAGLRHGAAEVRTKLLGMAAIDLFFGVILAACALWVSETWSIPDPVLSMVGTYITFGIVGSFLYLILLLHRRTRTWVDVDDVPAGRSH